MTTSIVDVHSHWFPPEYRAALTEVRERYGPCESLDRALADERVATIPEFTDLDLRGRLLTDAAITTQILSLSTPHVWHPDVSARRRLAEAFNDGCASAHGVDARLLFLATLPLPFVDACIEELRRVRWLPGCAGISVPTHVDGVGWDDARWTPLLEELDRGGQTVLVHPDGFCARGLLTQYYLDWTVGAPFEDTLCAMKLVHSGIIDRFPRIEWIVPHLGGLVPMILDRVDRIWALNKEKVGGEYPPSQGLRRLAYDTANTTPQTLRLAAAVLGADRLVFGTDFPYIDRHDLARPVRDIYTEFADAGQILAGGPLSIRKESVR
ncbi:amidohydrolase family protein [Rhodococcus koreensis]|uniref:amidohydrolase family protein n=1 Tax=Rhodococcus koreensis TaxID=99653 RepID=UPI0036704CD2